MRCESCRDKFSEHDENRLNPDEARQVQEHLSSCAECEEEYRQFSVVVNALRELGQVPPPKGLLDRIQHVLDATEPPMPMPHRRARLGPLVVAAACFAIIFAGLWVHQTGRQPDIFPQDDLMYSAAPHDLDSADERAIEAVPETESSVQSRGSTEDGGWGEVAVVPSGRDGAATDAVVLHAPRHPEALNASRRVVSRQSESGEASSPRKEAQDLMSGGGAQIRTAEVPSPPAAAAPIAQFKAADVDIPPNSKSSDGTLRYFDLPKVESMVPLAKSRFEPPPDDSRMFIRFVPPPFRRVHKPEVCAVVLTADHDMSEVLVRIEPRHSIRLSGLKDGVLYRGPLSAGEAKQIEFRIISEGEGTQRLRVSVETPVSGLEAQLEVVLPGFRADEQQAQSISLGEPITVVFRDILIRQALLQIARKGNVNLVLGSDVGGDRVNYSCTDIPAGAVVRAVAESYGYLVQYSDGTYYVSRSSVPSTVVQP